MTLSEIHYDQHILFREVPPDLFFDKPLFLPHRNLWSEVGILAYLHIISSFAPSRNDFYKTELKNGLCEYEYDHVLCGAYGRAAVINKDEVEEWQWVNVKILQNKIAENPRDFTYWFKLALPKFLEYFYR